LSRFNEAHSFASKYHDGELGSSTFACSAGTEGGASGDFVISGGVTGAGTGEAKLADLLVLTSVSRFLSAHSSANESHGDVLCAFVDACSTGTDDNTGGDSAALWDVTTVGFGAGTLVTKSTGFPMIVLAPLPRFIDAHSLASDCQGDEIWAFARVILTWRGGDIGDNTPTQGVTTSGFEAVDESDTGATKLAGLLVLVSLSLFLDDHSFAKESHDDASYEIIGACDSCTFRDTAGTCAGGTTEASIGPDAEKLVGLLAPPSLSRFINVHSLDKESHGDVFCVFIAACSACKDGDICEDIDAPGEGTDIDPWVDADTLASALGFVSVSRFLEAHSLANESHDDELCVYAVAELGG
jgi:hypothetical protein